MTFVMPDWSKVKDDSVIRLSSAAEKRTTGSIWSEKSVAKGSQEVILGFRVHGPEGNGGEGIALWFTAKKPAVDYMSTSFYGGPVRFNGIVIVLRSTGLTTDEKAAKAGGRPKVLVYRNDGSKPIPEQIAFFDCPNFKNPAGRSALKVSFSAEKMTIWLDRTHHGQIFDAVGEFDAPLPSEYFLGVSSSSFGRGDNFDLSHLDFYEISTAVPAKNEVKLSEEEMKKQKELHDFYEGEYEKRIKEKYKEEASNEVRILFNCSIYWRLSDPLKTWMQACVNIWRDSLART